MASQAAKKSVSQKKPSARRRGARLAKRSHRKVNRTVNTAIVAEKGGQWGKAKTPNRNSAGTGKPNHGEEAGFIRKDYRARPTPQKSQA